jgi:hypothetical protein
MPVEITPFSAIWPGKRIPVDLLAGGCNAGASVSTPSHHLLQMPPLFFQSDLKNKTTSETRQG